MTTTAVFGGTGFLGARVVAALLRAGGNVRVASRHPSSGDDGGTRKTMVRADITDPASLGPAVEGADAVVNCVGLYAEKGDLTFRAVHVDGARNLAAAVGDAQRLVHVSGIGADAGSPSPYVRSRGEGEDAIRAVCPGAVLVRPSVMFGAGDGFLGRLTRIAAGVPVFPLFGDGATRLQPVSADDVAGAIARLCRADIPPGTVYELGGPEVASYREIVERVLRWTGRRRPLLPVPFAAWDALAAAGKVVPGVPVSEGQVALMRADNVADDSLPGLSALGVAATPMAAAALA